MTIDLKHTMIWMTDQTSNEIRKVFELCKVLQILHYSFLRIFEDEVGKNGTLEKDRANDPGRFDFR